MRSLRTRLGAFAALGAFALTLVASIVIAIERWQEETARLADDVELAAVLLSEEPDPGATEISTGEAVFALIFDGSGETTGRAGPVGETLVEIVTADIWSETVDQDTVVTSELVAEDGRRVVVAGTQCTDAAACDSVAVGASEHSLGDYLAARWAWLIGPALLAGGLGWAGARFLVGRSLQPVDEMRVQLATITSSDLDRRVPVPQTGDELQALGSTVNGTIDRLATAVSANERFVADAAHELRSPITGVRAALELEASRNPGGILEDSVRELDRAGRMMDGLLVLARRQGRPLVTAELDVDDIVTRELSCVLDRFPELIVDRSVYPVRSVANADALRRVVANLLENAVRYGNGRIALSLGPDATGWSLTVADDGPGVPVDQRVRIFERFARLDESRDRSSGGSGLGLALVSELVADHGGTIAVGQSPLGGAAFTIRMPLQLGDGTTSAGPSPPG
jgi:signal transduction histidine kinase